MMMRMGMLVLRKAVRGMSCLRLLGLGIRRFGRHDGFRRMVIKDGAGEVEG